MTKRPSIVGSLKLADTSAEAAEGNAPVAAPKRRERPDIVHTSVYLPKAVYQQLREIAFARDCKIHDVIMEGVSAALMKHGKPSVEELKRISGEAP